jgi:hypothetical protein
MMKKKYIPAALRSYIEVGNSTLQHEGTDWLIELSPASESPWKKNLPAQSLIIAGNGCGEYLYLKIDQSSESNVYLPTVYVYWHEENNSEILLDSIEKLISPDPLQPSENIKVFYSDGTTEIRLGDEVFARDLFMRKQGRVVYVPGISKKNWNMEHNGLSWIGIKFKGGTFSGSYVDPETKKVKKSVKFIKRNNIDIEELGPNEKFE